MVHTEKESNGCAGGSGNESGIVALNTVLSANGTAKVENSGTNFTRLAGDSLRTYKRRKNVKCTDRGKVSEDSVSQITEKSVKPLLDAVPFTNFNTQVSGFQKVSDALMNSNDFSLKKQRNYVLEQICQSLESEGGLKKCIQNALLFHPGSGSRSTIKDSIYSCENGSKCSLQTGFVCDDIQNAALGSVGKTFRRSVNESNHCTGTELCRCMFSDIIMSEKFAQLCSLLLENFHGLKADKLLDLSLINSKMEEGAYESSPVLFYSDIQQVWKKLQKVGTDMTTLAKCLSDKSITSLSAQVGSSGHNIPEDYRHEFLTQESDMHAKVEQTEACPIFEVRSCRCCGEKSDGRNGLVCDSCEEMYHVSCIEPAVKEIPLRSWYCTTCSSKGIESPHDDCIACERLNASRSLIDADGGDDLVDEEAPEELEDSSNEIVSDEIELEREFQNCKVCGAEVGNDEDYRICGHSFCSQKFFHVRCLTSKQLKSYGPCWYCPSCLCRACLADRDDDKIVLCDGCDHAYHIYCMQPPRTCIPKGKWFCKKCNSDLQRMRRAKGMYENTQNTAKKRALDGMLKGEEGLDKDGGVDMLLNAAKTLNNEENQAAMWLNS
ncbi:PHD finger EHD3 isoform X1 [Olea europaea subsp. europaea]|uniref:PHD finger EHD3 isoform X1 n=1 Tax=Olea europaea subsp. europaea TaxID=158383 RepID=A0A8S0RQW0_OLEEU|nr:PHD finger EHD3 isoform X1 [Olea europaea subsp. europaea]